MSELILQDISIDDIIPDPTQPRKLPSLVELEKQAATGDLRCQSILDGLRGLANSIEDVGLEQPISVYPAEIPGKYIIYDGHRRWTAINMLHRQNKANSMVRCQVRPKPKSDDDIVLGQLYINLQREEFNVFEIARGLARVYNNLKKNGGIVRLLREDGTTDVLDLKPQADDEVIWKTVEQKMAISRPRRYQIQAVLKLPEDIQRKAEEAGLPESRLRYLIPITNIQILETIVLEMIELNLSNTEIKKRLKELEGDILGQSASAMPKPVQIRSALEPMVRLAKEISAVKNVPQAISIKDPRTVESYKKLIPDLENAAEDIQKVLEALKFLQEPGD
jgi:ParB/RepB/Spo0J family partition protein